MKEPAVLTTLDDLAAALGDDAVLAIVDAFKEASTKQLREMEEACVHGEGEKLRAEAHSLKSSAANLGAQNLSELCAKIEKSSAITPEISEMVQNAKLCQTLAVERMLNWRAGRS